MNKQYIKVTILFFISLFVLETGYCDKHLTQKIKESKNMYRKIHHGKNQEKVQAKKTVLEFIRNIHKNKRQLTEKEWKYNRHDILNLIQAMAYAEKEDKDLKNNALFIEMEKILLDITDDTSLPEKVRHSAWEKWQALAVHAKNTTELLNDFCKKIRLSPKEKKEICHSFYQQAKLSLALDETENKSAGYQGEYKQQAKEIFEVLVSIDGDSYTKVESLAVLADILEEEQKYEEAKEKLKEILAVNNPKAVWRVMSYAKQAELYIKLGQLEEAFECYKNIEKEQTEINEFVLYAWFEYAKIYRYYGKTEQAKEYYQKILNQEIDSFFKRLAKKELKSL